MDNLKGKRILIFQQRGWALNVGHFLAKKLQAEGAVLAALTAKRTTHEFIVNQKEVKYEQIISSDEAKSCPRKFLGEDDYSLSKICADLGVDSIWPLVAGARNHVRSYADKYYYSFRQNVPDEGIIEYVKAVYKYMTGIFNSFKPDIIIVPNFPTLHHLMFYHYASRRGVKMIALTDSKISGNYIFSYSYNYDEGPFIERLKQLNETGTRSPSSQKAESFIEEFRKSFKNPEGMEYWNLKNKKRTVMQKIRTGLSPYYHIVKWYLRKPENYWESIGPSIDYRPPKIILRDHYAYARNRRLTNKLEYFPLEKAGRFAYFPLQVQPEEAIDIIAPYFSNQIETARQVAMSLPQDLTLVVKEHPAMVGLRSPSYLEKLSRTPNVKLIDYRISSETILSKALLIIAPNGTTLAEAALLRKPAIQLGNLGTTKQLPNVFHHTDMTTLSKKIKEVLGKDMQNSEYDRKLINYISAAFDTGVELKYVSMWERGEAKAELEKLWDAYKNELIRSLKK